ncbi:hypothetical protein PINS_up003390 [Pythium insidiosum]|nr:hypothetical protein PINS_up003390 [Pythium insidiosum]
MLHSDRDEAELSALLHTWRHVVLLSRLGIGLSRENMKPIIGAQGNRFLELFDDVVVDFGTRKKELASALQHVRGVPQKNTHDFVALEVINDTSIESWNRLVSMTRVLHPDSHRVH